MARINGGIPEVSVLILTYNQADVVSHAIDSVMSQHTDFPFEVIIADDASTDSTPEIIREYAVRYPGIIRPILREKNIGLVANYFDTLGRARGNYIADCAGDDAWTGADRLQTLRDSLLDNPDAVLVHSQWQERNAATGDVRTVEPGDTPQPNTPGSTMREPLLAHTTPLAVHLSTALYRRQPVADALERDGDMICNKDFGCEDLPLLMALSTMGNFAYLPMVTLSYTVGDETISAPRSVERQAQYAARAALTTATLARHYGVASKRIDRYIRRQIGIITGAARRSGNGDLIGLADRIVRTAKTGMPLKSRVDILLTRLLTSRLFPSPLRNQKKM